MIVVQIEACEYDEYGGRAKGGVNEVVGEYGWLGNPFRIGADGNREAVIAKFKRYFWGRINRDEEYLKAVLELEDKVVGCWCKPKACHLDVIVDWFKAGKPLK